MDYKITTLRKMMSRDSILPGCLGNKSLFAFLPLSFPMTSDSVKLKVVLIACLLGQCIAGPSVLSKELVTGKENRQRNNKGFPRHYMKRNKFIIISNFQQIKI